MVDIRAQVIDQTNIPLQFKWNVETKFIIIPQTIVSQIHLYREPIDEKISRLSTCRAFYS